MAQALDPGPFGDLPLLVTQPLSTILVASFLLGDNLCEMSGSEVARDNMVRAVLMSYLVQRESHMRADSNDRKGRWRILVLSLSESSVRTGSTAWGIILEFHTTKN